MRNLLLAASVVLAPAIVTPASAATLFTETFNDGTFGRFTATAGAPIEVTTGRPGYVACCSATGSEAALTNPFVAFGGGNVANSGGLSTTFATTLGQLYTLSFRYAALGGGTTNLSYSLSGAGALNPLAGTLTPVADNNFDTTFKTFTSTFTGVGGNVTLRFASTGQQDNVDAALDDVQVAAVPEPATWAMMFLGFGMIGATARYRRRGTKVTYA